MRKAIIALMLADLMLSGCGEQEGGGSLVVTPRYFIAHIESPTANDLNSVFVATESEVWAVGDKGTIVRCKENSPTLIFNPWLPRPSFSCKLVPSPTEQNLNAAWFTDPHNGWAVGDNGIILRYQNDRWLKFPSPTVQTLSSMCFNSSSDGWAAGADLLHFDGHAWVRSASPGVSTLTDISCVSNNSVWGISNTMAPSFETYMDLTHYNGSEWALVDRKQGLAFYQALSFTGDSIGKLISIAAIFCPNASIYKYYSGYLKLDKSFNYFLYDLNCLDAGECWAVGAGEIANYYGQKWVGVFHDCEDCIGCGSDQDTFPYVLNSVQAVKYAEAWAAGKSGAIFFLRREGQKWGGNF